MRTLGDGSGTTARQGGVDTRDPPAREARAGATRAAKAKPKSETTQDSAKRPQSLERIGLYPGTFDPPTNGHLDIIARASKLVDRLVIGVAVNRDKGPLFSLEERVDMLERECARIPCECVIEVKPFETLLMHFAEDVRASIIVRGLRAVSDFEYEFQMVGMNQKLNPAIETVFLMADPTHQAVASRLVKEIARLGGDVRQFVPEAVAARLKTRFGAG